MLILKVHDVGVHHLPGAEPSNVVAHPSILTALNVRETPALTWVVVEDACSTMRIIMREFPFFWQAKNYVAEHGEGQIMKRLPTGELTVRFGSVS